MDGKIVVRERKGGCPSCFPALNAQCAIGDQKGVMLGDLDEERGEPLARLSPSTLRCNSKRPLSRSSRSCEFYISPRR